MLVGLMVSMMVFMMMGLTVLVDEALDQFICAQCINHFTKHFSSDLRGHLAVPNAATSVCFADLLRH